MNLSKEVKMDIKVKDTKFEDLEIGDIFEDSGYYVKINWSQAFNLSKNFTETNILPSHKVLKKKATLVVED
jgi:hypothetical protein